MSRQGFIEPPPIDRRSNGLKIISSSPTRQLQSTPTYSKKQELSNGTWKKYFGVFSMVSKIQKRKRAMHRVYGKHCSYRHSDFL